MMDIRSILPLQPLKSLIFFVAVFTSQTAWAQTDRFEVGQLTCTVEGGVSFIVGSSKDLRCTFDPVGARYNETYVGEVNKFGLDLGFTGKTVIVWAVLAPTDDLPPSSLTGTYVGAAADAAIAVGGGAKILVGGSNDTIMLQPVSVQAQTGLNLALTVAEVKLRAVGRKILTTYRTRYKRCGTTVRLATGDTLADVAGRCGRSVDDLLEANPSIKNLRNISTNTLIKVPAYPTPSNRGTCGTHATLGVGENLYQLAARCGYTVGALFDANPGLLAPGAVKAGRVVDLPPYVSTLGRQRCPVSLPLGAPGRQNDTLDDIAENCGTSVDALLAANPKVANVREIPNGTNIRVPRRTRSHSRGTCGSHAVAKSGENIVMIANRCSVSAGLLIDANYGTRDLLPLEVGRTIDIPR